MQNAKRMKVKSGTLAFCVCSYSACESQRGGHGQRGGGAGDKRRRIFICEMRRRTEVPMANNTSSGSGEKMMQRVTPSCRMNIIRQNAVNAELWTR